MTVERKEAACRFMVEKVEGKQKLDLHRPLK